MAKTVKQQQAATLSPVVALRKLDELMAASGMAAGHEWRALIGAALAAPEPAAVELSASRHRTLMEAVDESAALLSLLSSLMRGALAGDVEALSMACKQAMPQLLRLDALNAVVLSGLDDAVATDDDLRGMLAGGAAARPVAPAPSAPAAAAAVVPAASDAERWERAWPDDQALGAAMFAIAQQARDVTALIETLDEDGTFPHAVLLQHMVGRCGWLADLTLARFGKGPAPVGANGGAWFLTEPQALGVFKVAIEEDE